MTTLAFAAKKHMRHAGSAGAFAVYLDSIDGTYLGDVGRVHVAAGRLLVKAPDPAELRSERIGWWALPSGESERLPLAYLNRTHAAEALRRRWDEKGGVTKLG